jgi:membrane associated rhomboid family serine protease
MFFHGSILHLGGNMLFLWIFGNNIEDRLGKVGYLVFYLVTGFVAAAAHILTQPDSIVPVVGASGAIAGVMGAYLVFFPKARVLTIIPLFIFIQFVYLPAFVVLLAWFLLQFLTNVDSGVAVMAHIGGFVSGAAIALALKPFVGVRARRPPPDLDFGGFGPNPYR